MQLGRRAYYLVIDIMFCERFPFVIFLMIFMNHEKMSVSSAKKRMPASKIHGGVPVNPGEFSHMALIHGEESIWSGAILTEKHVLTSAMLSASYLRHKYREVLVKIGSNEYEDLEIHRIKHVVIHPKFYQNYPKQLVRYDIAVITLCDHIDFNKNKQPVRLPSSEVTDGLKAFVTGWGITEDGDVGALNKLETTVYNVESCFTEPIHDRSQICTKNEKGKGYCSGDGGSPLVVDGNILVGMASIFNHACGNGKDIYTNVYECLDFIYAQIHSLTCRKPMNYTTVRSITQKPKFRAININK